MARRLEGVSVRRLLSGRSRSASPANAGRSAPAPPAGAASGSVDGAGSAHAAEARGRPVLPDSVVHSELDRVTHLLEERGPLTGAELQHAAGAEDWDPTAWARVLRVGSREEQIVHRGGQYFATYSAAQAPEEDRRRRDRR